MEREPGLYVTLLPENRIKKILTDEDGEVTESEVSIADELIFLPSVLLKTLIQSFTQTERNRPKTTNGEKVALAPLVMRLTDVFPSSKPTRRTRKAMTSAQMYSILP